MGNEDIIKLFKVFVGGDFIDVHGVKLVIERISNDGKKLIFTLDNQKDISYHQDVVEEMISIYLDDFFNYTNIKLKSFIDSCDKLYFNEELKNKITDTLKKIKQLKISDDDDFNDESIVILGEHNNFNLSYSSDRISIYNFFEPHEGYIKSLNGGIIKNSNLSEVIKKYYRFCKRMSTGFESDEIYIEIDTILNDYPLISESGIAFYYHTSFLPPNIS